jgi:hypothetical protein
MVYVDVSNVLLEWRPQGGILHTAKTGGFWGLPHLGGPKIRLFAHVLISTFQQTRILEPEAQVALLYGVRPERGHTQAFSTAISTSRTGRAKVREFHGKP